MTTTLIKTIIIDAPRDLVWSFLTDKDRLGQWYHAGQASLADGHDYRLGTSDSGEAVIWGKVLTWTPPAKLVTTFCIGPFGGRETTVTWDLADVAGATHLTMTHKGIVEAGGDAPLGLLQALDTGWDAHLGDLRNAARN